MNKHLRRDFNTGLFVGAMSGRIVDIKEKAEFFMKRIVSLLDLPSSAYFRQPFAASAA